MPEEGENTLKDGEVAISEKDLSSLKKAKADMETYKREKVELQGNLDELTEEVEKLKEAAKSKAGEGDTDAKAVENAVAEANRKAEKALKDTLAAQEQGMTVKHAAQLAFVKAEANEVFLGSVDLSDVIDAETAKERVETFLKEHPEVITKGKEPEPEPKVPPVTTGPSTGPPPPGAKADEGPQTPGEREAALRQKFSEDGLAVSRSTGPYKPSG